MNRVAIFAHYDDRGEIEPYVVRHLAALREECSSIAFVSTAELLQSELDKVRPYCSTAVVRENMGYDFAMWQHALASLDLSRVSELCLTNSSIMGPVFPLRPIFERMSASSCDFWGMTDSFEISEHLQSYFLVFKRPVLASARFSDFFRSVLPYRDKDQIIRSYEIGLSICLREAGFEGQAMVAMGSWLSSVWRRERLRRKRKNATLYYPTELLRAGMPFVKLGLFAKNPARVPLRPVLDAMQRAGYDLTEMPRSVNRQ